MRPGRHKVSNQEVTGILMFSDCPCSPCSPIQTKLPNELCWSTGFILESLVRHSTPNANGCLLYTQSLSVYNIMEHGFCEESKRTLTAITSV